jgi:putative transposase
MKKSRFSESQIVNILKEAEAGVSVEELSRQHGFSKATFYKWKAKYGGMNVSEVKRMKELEEENRRLKQMYANLSLEHEVLKDIIPYGKNSPSSRKAETSQLCRTGIWSG